MISQDAKMWAKLDASTFMHWAVFGFVATLVWKGFSSHVVAIVYAIIFLAFNTDSWHRCATFTKDRAERLAGRKLVAAPNDLLLLLHRIFFFVLIFGGLFIGYYLAI